MQLSTDVLVVYKLVLGTLNIMSVSFISFARTTRMTAVGRRIVQIYVKTPD